MAVQPRPAPKRWNLGGIGVFQAEVPGRIRAGLVFRVGHADEPLHMAGVTHLIEHLALSGFGEEAFEYNGMVDQTTTSFVVSGTAEQVVEFFKRVTAALQSLPLDRVPTECRIIETEAAGHRRSSFRGSMSLRYGAMGFATVDFDQIGLMWLTPQAVGQWAANHFTAGNCAAWVAGPVIPSLKIELPPGPRNPPPPLVPKNLPLPVVAEHPSPGVTASMVAPRSTALLAGLAILQHRAMQRIRHLEGLSYSVQSDYGHLDGQTAHALVTTDVLPEHAKQAGSALLDVADVLSLTGPEPAELARELAQADEAYSDPQSLVSEMSAMVADELLGVTPRVYATTRAELGALKPPEVAAALKVALDSMILIVPSGTRSPRPHFPDYPYFEAHPLQGTEVRSAYNSGEVIIVGPSGISLCDSNRRALSILWQEIAAGARWPDGTRLLVGRNGTNVMFRPRVWSNPGVVLAAIDGNAPADRFIESQSPSPSADLPRPPSNRTGSILAGRGNVLLIAAGAIIAVVGIIFFLTRGG